jgi:lipopolysaccharide transport system ATP-binding protein
VKAAISVEGLGKRYVISHRAPQRYRTLRDEFAEKIMGAFQRAGDRFSATLPAKEDFWAVRDVSFEVREGDRVGIIGRNGAGKSTLLKMLSRITEPTEGRIALQGRVSSLLEVGTGFHPELTGRENIFLNGSILGMKRQEIQAKFDEIVSFSGVEKFLDTPVKRYSSGMYVRLAFAVAAHLDSEILLVDEVLAVGDAEFQAKCLTRMESISASGRTVLFVSHNLSAVQRLCSTGVFMNAGRLVAQGAISNVLEAYQDAISGTSANSAGIEVNPGQAKFTRWELESASTRLSHTCHSRDVCRFVFSLASRRAIQDAYFGLALWDSEGQLIVAGSSLDDGGRAVGLGEGEHRVVFEVRLPIKAGAYQLDVSLNGVGEGQIDRWHAVPKLIVLPSGDSSLPERWHGILNEKVRFSGPSI